MSADVCGVEVIAGPVEGAVLGNVLIQARAVQRPSAAKLDLAGLRELGARGITLKHYLPSGSVTEEQIAKAEQILSPKIRSS